MDPLIITGPVAARVEVDIDASQRDVWSVLADINAWSTWNPSVREAALDAGLEVGARFRYATAFGKMRARLWAVEAPRRLAWSARMLTMGHQQLFELAATDAVCRVTAEATLSGPGAWLFKARLDERLRADLDATLQLLKLEAETRAAGDLDHAATGELH